MERKKTLLIYNKPGKLATNDNPSTEESSRVQTGDNIQLLIADEENSYFINE